MATIKSKKFYKWVVLTAGSIFLVLVVVALIHFYQYDGLFDIVVEAVSAAPGEIIISYKEKDHVRAQKYDLYGNCAWGDAGVILLPEIPDRGYSLISDSLGGAFIFLYIQEKNGNSEERPLSLVPVNILVQRFDSYGDRLWGEGIELGKTILSGTRRPAAVPDGQGGAILAWNEYQPSRQVDEALLCVNRINADGQLLWGDEGISVPVSTGRIMPHYNKQFAILADGLDGVFIIWDEKTNTDMDTTHIRQIDKDGRFTWPESIVIKGNGFLSAGRDSGGGVFVQTTMFLSHITNAGKLLDEVGIRTRAVIVFNDAGGFFEIDIMDEPPKGDRKTRKQLLYLQRLDQDGQAVWPERCVIDPGDEHWIDARQLIDGVGGLFIVWQPIFHTYAPTGDILITRISGDGKQLWEIPFTHDNHGVNTRSSGLFADGEGGGILVTKFRTRWFDNRKVYAQRFNPSGDLLWKREIQITN